MKMEQNISEGEGETWDACLLLFNLISDSPPIGQAYGGGAPPHSLCSVAPLRDLIWPTNVALAHNLAHSLPLSAVFLLVETPSS